MGKRIEQNSLELVHVTVPFCFCFYEIMNSQRRDQMPRKTIPNKVLTYILLINFYCFRYVYFVVDFHFNINHIICRETGSTAQQ